MSTTHDRRFSDVQDRTAAWRREQDRELVAAMARAYRHVCEHGRQECEGEVEAETAPRRGGHKRPLSSVAPVRPPLRLAQFGGVWPVMATRVPTRAKSQKYSASWSIWATQPWLVGWPKLPGSCHHE